MSTERVGIPCNMKVFASKAFAIHAPLCHAFARLSSPPCTSLPLLLLAHDFTTIPTLQYYDF